MNPQPVAKDEWAECLACCGLIVEMRSAGVQYIMSDPIKGTKNYAKASPRSTFSLSPDDFYIQAVPPRATKLYKLKHHEGVPGRRNGGVIPLGTHRTAASSAGLPHVSPSRREMGTFGQETVNFRTHRSCWTRVGVMLLAVLTTVPPAAPPLVAPG